MSDHRTDRVYMPDDEARCEPLNPCHDKLRCARYMAAIPARNATLIGGASSPLFACGYFLPLAHFTRPSAGDKPRVHPPIGSGQ